MISALRSADTGRNPSYYDAILTGDLGHIGKEILTELAETKSYNIKANYNDCGVLMFDKATQDTHSGGSGCGRQHHQEHHDRY